jgi:hypothetical protein
MNWIISLPNDQPPPDCFDNYKISNIKHNLFIYRRFELNKVKVSPTYELFRLSPQLPRVLGSIANMIMYVLVPYTIPTYFPQGTIEVGHPKETLFPLSLQRCQSMKTHPPISSASATANSTNIYRFHKHIGRPSGPPPSFPSITQKGE